MDGSLCYRGTGWLMGTARFADWQSLAWAGYLGSSKGVLVGSMPAPGIRESARQVFRLPRKLSFTACLLFFAAMRKRPIAVRVNPDPHLLCCAPTGAGKGINFVIPYLLEESRDSCVVVDPKRENAQRCARTRRRMGQTVIHLDPFGANHDCFNPLDMIDTKSPTWLDDVRSLAAALVVRSGQEHEPHWNDSAELVIAAVIAFVCTEEPVERDLQFVAQILSNPAALSKVQLALLASKAPLLARFGGQLSHLDSKERNSVLTTANRHLAFLSSEPLLKNLTRTTFDWRKLRERMTVFLTVPLEYLESHRGLLRLWIASFLRIVAKGGLNERQPVSFVLDEAAALGKLDPIKNALTQLRGYGLRMQVYVQSVAQLEEMFPQQSQTALGNFSTQIFFGLNDYQTAEAVLKRIGQTTYQKWDASGGESTSRSYDHEGKQSTSRSWNDNWLASEVTRELIKPEEILNRAPQQAFVFTKNAPPLDIWLTPYFSRQFKKLKPLGFFASLRMTAQALVLACIGVGLVAAVGFVAVKEAERIQKFAPAYPPPFAGEETKGEVPRDEPGNGAANAPGKAVRDGPADRKGKGGSKGDGKQPPVRNPADKGGVPEGPARLGR